MRNWFRQLRQPKELPLHPPWEVGQYVTYFLQRDDGSWVAFMLRLVGKTEDGAWVICADFKNPAVENRVWYRCDPNANDPELPNIVPGKVETVRGSTGELDFNDPNTWNMPVIHLTLAMNLLFVRDYPAAANALQSRPRAVDYACGIKRAYTFVAPALGYEKHIDLNPRVMLTGVACQSTNGEGNPILVTSFGMRNSDAHSPSVYEDFVDFSHMTRVQHEGFALTYPATWFLRPREDQASPGSPQEYVAEVGGNTCAAMLFVRIRTGTRDHLIEERDKLTTRFTAGFSTARLC